VNLRNINELEDEDVSARILPNENRTNEILNKIKAYDWCYNVNLDEIQLKNETDSCVVLINKKAITKLHVYAISFNEKSNKIDLKLLNQ
jgi:hypothetical protein